MKSEIKVILVVFLSLLGFGVYTYQDDLYKPIDAHTRWVVEQKAIRRSIEKARQESREDLKKNPKKYEDFKRFGRNRGKCGDYYSFERENEVKSGEEIRA
jgi:hypothetical protein